MFHKENEKRVVAAVKRTVAQTPHKISDTTQLQMKVWSEASEADVLGRTSKSSIGVCCCVRQESILFGSSHMSVSGAEDPEELLIRTQAG